MWPRIVADALDAPPIPPRPRGRDVTCDAALWETACQQAWRPAEHEGPPPAWLRTHQVLPWRRSVAALRQFGGAILAEPVGAGKTWIALAAIHALGRRATVVAPAVLLPQWQAAVAMLRLPVRLHSLERCSRGTPPADVGGMVVVDEAHRLRHLSTRRARTLAESLAHHPALLLTATPIVNRRRDLLALLQLVVSDDVLRYDGVLSLDELAAVEHPHPALRRLVVRTNTGAATVPLATRRLPMSPPECARARRAAEGIASLHLATTPGDRRLLRGVLADAAASSDAAWQTALQRSESLIRQAKEAGGLSRDMLRRFAGPACDQGVLWQLVAPEAQDRPALLPTADLPRLRALRLLPPADAHWLAEVDHVLADDAVTVIFCRYRATAHVLRHHLGDPVAWVTGHEAGLGPHRLARHLILAAFGPTRAEWRVRHSLPRVLIATDVVAEGLDLQAASRVIHVDLPWTAMRRDQRNGRLRRPGQSAPRVEVIERHPPPALERLLRLGWRIHTKATIAERWLTVLEHDNSATIAAPATGVARGAGERLWLVRVGHGDTTIGTLVVASNAHSTWVPSSPEVRHLLQRAAGAPARSQETDPSAMTHDVLAAAHRVLTSPNHYPTLITRVQRLARTIGHRRDSAGLAALNQLLEHLNAPGPLGQRQALERLRDASDTDLLTHGLPYRGPAVRPRMQVVASVVVPVDSSPLRSPDDPLLNGTL